MASERSTIRVFAVATSSPLSTIVVVTRTSDRPSRKCFMTPSRARSGICPCAVTKRTQPLGDLVYALDAVVDEEDLAVAGDLPLDGMLYEVLVVGADVREDAAAPRRGRLDHAYVAQRGEAHLHGAWDRGRRQREDVYGGLVLLDALFVPHAETLLLVHDDEPKISGHDLGPEQRVRSDEHVHLPGPEVGKDPAPIGGQGEARETLDPDGVGSEPLFERPLVLLYEDSSRGEHHGLLSCERRLEGGPHGDLRLAEADVPADQAVHRVWPLHIRLDCGDGRFLIRRLLVGEALLELLLPLPIFGEG